LIGLSSIVSYHADENPISGKVMQKRNPSLIQVVYYCLEPVEVCYNAIKVRHMFILHYAYEYTGRKKG
ncbi:MAG TPA: hypothetical protein DDZ89_14840, partial [Clostridiales bacterium]|nr:hypothetical protein [Clostridiales bacterium]